MEHEDILPSSKSADLEVEAEDAYNAWAVNRNVVIDKEDDFDFQFVAQSPMNGIEIVDSKPPCIQPVTQKCALEETQGLSNATSKEFSPTSAISGFSSTIQESSSIAECAVEAVWEECKQAPDPKSGSTVSFSQCLDYFSSLDLHEYAQKIKPVNKLSGVSAFWNVLLGPPKLCTALFEERNLVFTLALYPFSNLELIHSQMLQTIYKRLTRSHMDCPRFGSHWEEIGFQGRDPATDLRGCGMLALLNLVFLCTDAKYCGIAHEAYKLSLDEVQHFPFCVLSINMTRIALQLLRDGKLNKICNKQNSVFPVFLEMYVALFYEVFRVWKHQGKTMNESGFVIADVEAQAKKRPLGMVLSLRKLLQEKSVSSASDGLRGKSEDLPRFIGVEELISADSKSLK